MPTVDDPFAKSDPAVRATYDALLRAARSRGTVTEDPKKTLIHLNRTSAFAGVAVRKSSLILTLKAAAPISSDRVRRTEPASAHRWHLEIPLSSAKDVDAELRRWIAAAYELG